MVLGKLRREERLFPSTKLVQKAAIATVYNVHGFRTCILSAILKQHCLAFSDLGLYSGTKPLYKFPVEEEMQLGRNACEETFPILFYSILFYLSY